MTHALPYKISTLIFIQNTLDQQLLIQRTKAPNKDCWSPIGGKLDMHIGESPYECARREINEEIGLLVTDQDLHCFGYVSEKSYEGTGHWLMFLFQCKQKIQSLPATIEEGRFAFYSRDAIDNVKVPESDRLLIWPYYDNYRDRFIGIRADCSSNHELNIVEELKLK